MACSRCVFLSTASPPPTSKFRSIPLPIRSFRVVRRRRSLRPIRALREWSEYEDAVKEKDLARALRFLRSMELESEPPLPMEPSSSPLSSSSPVNGSMRSTLVSPELWRPERDWEVLDTCLNADDMRLVGSAYAFLQERGLLPNFGKYRSIASKFAPKKWGLSGFSNLLLIGSLGGVSFLLSQGIDIRPNIAAVLALGMLDAIFLGGSCVAQIMSFWPPYKRRILVHEAGHLLIAYLMGCPIRGVILDPLIAMQMGIKGQAGTQFWDENLEREHAEGHLSGITFDRYCMIMFAGIAAEALVYGEAEGGENDENLFRRSCTSLRPPLTVAQMSNRARWSVLQSYNLLKWHKHAHKAAVKALEGGHSLGVVIRRIEETLSSQN